MTDLSEQKAHEHIKAQIERDKAEIEKLKAEIEVLQDEIRQLQALVQLNHVWPEAVPV